MSKNRFFTLSLLAFALLGVMVTRAGAQTPEIETVEDAAAVLDETMHIPARSIPRSLLARAEGVVIVPGMLKGGFVVGVRHGRGVALVRDRSGAWTAPRFVEMTGGSVGFQAGVQSTDVVLVFMTKKSIDGLLRGKFTIGADASASAGPVGRNVAAATDERLGAEILSYSRSRGLFAGVALDGSSIQLDYRAEHAFYGPGRRGRPRPLPAQAVELSMKLAAYSGSPISRPPADTGEEAAPPAPGDSADAARERLSQAAIELSAVLPDDWRRYLAMPAEVYGAEEHPHVDAIKSVLDRFDRVAQDPRYRGLTDRKEFQKAYSALKAYVAVLTPGASRPLPLPPPPLGAGRR